MGKMGANVYRALVGNVLICGAKFAAWISSGSSSMLAEFIHSIIDVGNQSLLLVGLRDSRMGADRRHQYGYGKSIYFWALVSALGTFFMGAGVSMTHSLAHLHDPTLQEITGTYTATILMKCISIRILASPLHIFSSSLECTCFQLCCGWIRF